MLNKIKNINSLEELTALHTEVFGKNGSMTLRLKSMKDLSNEERAALNLENTELREAFKTRQEELEIATINKALAKQKLDATLDPAPEFIGHLHPLTRSLQEIASILVGMGYQLHTGPEIEDDWHNFTALNTPEHHPARDMQDTFWTEKGNVMRTQTSAIQIRVMEHFVREKLYEKYNGIKIFGIGATYRREMDATHTPMFHQIEGLHIGKNVTLQDMITDIKTFLAALFGLEDVPLRIRPSYFPFTEPSVEIDMQWTKKTGQLGIGEDWLEIMGAGMVHPNVLKNSGLDPNEWQGFAFGFGWDRLTMLKYGLNDLRKFFEGDVRWSKA
jgi:phenylalanyl-tRNA synthetase alpha chain